MSITVYSNPEQYTSPRFARAFVTACRGEIVQGNVDVDEAWAGFGDPQSWGALQRAIRARKDWYYGDHSYFKEGRKKFYRITKNAFQHHGEGMGNENSLSQFFTGAAPFKKDGRHILICMHSDSFHERMGSPNPEYFQSIERRISAYSDRPIVVRYKRSETPFMRDLDGAWAVVTHSSMTALEALMRGVPAFMTSDSALRSLTLRDPINIEWPLYPSAEQRMMVASVLARNQWTMDEISNGKAWRVLNETV